MGGVLKADLDALGRLKPEIEALIAELKVPSAGTLPYGADPALTAMHSLMSETLPGVGAVLAGWMGAVDAVVGAFQRGMVETEEQGVALMRLVASPLRQ
ncbi:hypothetical protein ACM0AZ_12580 [Mycobacteroides abscessus subsp. massiliense]|uniref:hypothetical protein n=1 Tax=Mycobacteroides abscessus TaxID=36809 RepID=UPI0009A61D41|nr:hypothetical protein [Mycobacteroides abscessus]MBN7467076.1 hypothetical protein [Mycobacteroides abscessus subsp. massiliense]MBN7566658.1 hypothetical protein [Mycobacteroides abscessus subsp. massiliense]SLI45198.1 Uncharacterised protein [Mycobacteroides abscessus subsp. massiliense]SLI53678.1 Uncharacterised protein [Mycobacteroides abscessus subsp. massiliense]